VKQIESMFFKNNFFSVYEEDISRSIDFNAKSAHNNAIHLTAPAFNQGFLPFAAREIPARASTFCRRSSMELTDQIRLCYFAEKAFFGAFKNLSFSWLLKDTVKLLYRGKLREII